MKHEDCISTIKAFQSENATLKAQREELLEALKRITFAFKLVSPLYSGDREAIRVAEKAIENTKP